MGKIVRNKIKGMSMKARAALISLFTLLLMIGLYQGWQMTSHAAIGAPNAWTSAYSGTAYPNSATVANLTIPAGSNRMLIVAIASTQTATGTALTITNSSGTGGSTPTVGTRPMTLAAGDSASTVTVNHSALYYLKEADIAAAGANPALGLRIAGGTSYNTFIYYRVYTDVDQSIAPTAANFNSNGTALTAVGPFSPALAIDVNDQAVEVVNLSRSASATAPGTLRTITTWATGWTTAGVAVSYNATTGFTSQVYIRDRNLLTAASETSQHTASSASTYKSMTALSMKAAATNTSLTVNGNYAPAASSKLDTDTGVLMQRVTVTGTGTLEINSLTLADIGSVSTVAAAEIYISPTLQNTLPVDAILIGSATNWGGTSTQFDLTTIAGTQANRTLTGTTPKYIYIVYDMSAGQAGQTAQSSITAVGVVSPNVGATGLSLNSNIVTLTYSGNTLTTSASTTGAVAAKDSDVAVVMQHFRVDCDTAFDNSIEINSLGIQDNGTASQISAVKVYIATAEGAAATDLPSSAVLIGQITDWNKAFTTIPLSDAFGAVPGDRLVTAGTPKYIYVVYSMFYADDPFVPGLTVQSSVSAVGAASPDRGASGAISTSNSITLTRGTWSKITSCGGCHATTGLIDVATRNASPGSFPGSHAVHNTTNNIDCSACHVKPTVYNHANGFINFSGELNGGKYSRAPSDRVAVANAPYTATAYTFGTCSNTLCHGTISPTWGANTTDASCVKCHGVKGTTAAQYTATPNTAAPGYNGTGIAINGATAPSDAKVGAHDAHLRGLNNITTPIACAECHTVPVIATDAGHFDASGSAEVPMNGTLAKDNSAVPAYNSGTCTNTYCHFGKAHNAAYLPATANAAVVWNNTGYLVNAVADCQKCHLSPPSSTGIHAGKTIADCNTCHSHVSTLGAITDKTKHMNGIVEATGGHSFPYSGPTHYIAAGTTPWSGCSCHNTTATGTTYTTWAATLRGTAPNCTTCHLSGLLVPSGTSSCWDCHGSSATNAQPNGGIAAFPNYSGSHPAHIRYGMVCANCHNGAGSGTANHGNSNAVAKTRADVTLSFNGNQATPTYTGTTLTCTVACHAQAVWGTHLDCVACHTNTVVIGHGPLTGSTRRAVAAELKSSGSKNHKQTAAGTDALKWDCIVCHLEGDSTTGDPSPTYHGNGVIEFRDPDTGAQIKKVAWGGAAFTQNSTDAAGRYKDTLTNYTTSRFSRDLSVVLESDKNWLGVASIQMNLCLKCHDNNGAASSTAWTKNASGTVTGTSSLPFGNTSVSSTLTLVPVTATLKQAAGNVTGAVMNVFSQLSSGNAAYHPVRARGNNNFTSGLQMKAPWGNTTKATANTVFPANTIYGYLVSCFDCHVATASTGPQSRTYVAHGNGTNVAGAAMRGPSSFNQASVATPNLCTTCHADSYGTTSNQHASGTSAFNGGSSMNTSTMGVCKNCHGSYTDTVGSRAVGAHGADVTESGLATWPTTNSRPYAFIRGTNWTYWGPGSCSNSCTTRTYSPGGMY